MMILYFISYCINFILHQTQTFLDSHSRSIFQHEIRAEQLQEEA